MGNKVRIEGDNNLVFQDVENVIFNVSISGNGDDLGVILFLKLEKKGDNYLASLHVNAEGESAVLVDGVEISLSSNFSEKLADFEKLRINRNKNLFIKHVSDEELGAAIYEQFFSRGIGEYFNDFFDLLGKQKINHLHLVISTTSPEILNTPFECMISEDRDIPYALAHGNYALLRSKEKDLKSFLKSGFKATGLPIKILFVTSLPEDLIEHERFIQLEKERERLIEAVAGPMERREVVVEFLEVANLDSLENALQNGHHHILHISGHASFGTDQGGIIMENDAGNTHRVTGTELGNRLQRFSFLRLVVISACDTGRAEGHGVAGALLECGIPAILAMRYTVSDEAAQTFTTELYRQIGRQASFHWAIHMARRVALELDEVRKKEKQSLPNEWLTPFFYANQPLLPIVDSGKSRENTDHFRQRPKNFLHVKDGHKRDVSSGFIGRRKQLIKLTNWFKNGKSVCIHGLGGLGKTTLAIRFADNYENQQYDIIQFQGPVNEKSILDRLGSEAQKFNSEIIRVLETSNLPPNEKLSYLIENHFKSRKTIFFFDNFEDNQGGDGDIAKILSPSLKEFLTTFLNLLSEKNHFLFTTRYRVKELNIEFLPLDEISFPDAFRLMVQFPSLEALNLQNKREIHLRLGGHPRSYELLDRFLGHSEVDWEEVEKQFSTLNKAVNEDILYELLWERLTEVEQSVLRIISVFRTPVSISNFKKLARVGHVVDAIEEILEKLSDLSLMYNDGQFLLSHRSTSLFVLAPERIDPASKRKLHFDIGDFLYSRDHHSISEFKETLEAWWHFIQAGEYEEAAKVASSLDPLKTKGHLNLILDLYKVVLKGTISEKTEAGVNHQIGVVYEIAAMYGMALKHLRIANKLFIKEDDGESIASSYHQIALVLSKQNEFEKAIDAVSKAIEFRKEFKDEVGIADSFQVLGGIFSDMGEFDSALLYFEKSRTIYGNRHEFELKEALVKQHIAHIWMIRNEMNLAMQYYQEGLKIFQKHNSLEEIAHCLRNIATVHQEKREFNIGVVHCKRSIEIAERIGARLILAQSIACLATLQACLGKNEEALMAFHKSDVMFKNIGVAKWINLSEYNVVKFRKQFSDEEFDRLIRAVTKGQKISL